jgi:hypothetical protein
MHSLGICPSLAPEEVDYLRVKFAVRQDLSVALLYPGSTDRAGGLAEIGAGRLSGGLAARESCG